MNKRFNIGGGGKSSYSKGFNNFNCHDFINFCQTIFKKTLAFTLAETLIVMGIIGVVAALTLPNLNSSTGDREKVAKLQKIYSDLSDAYGRAVAVYGPIEEWVQNDSTDSAKTKRIFERITEFMKYSKSCTVSNCMVFDTGGTSAGESNGVNYGVILADGAAIGFYYNQIDFCTVKIDLDGFNKGANTQCKDYFRVIINEKQGVHFVTNYESGYNSSGCTAWVLINKNMDYLKTNDQSIGGKCPDGKTVLNWTTNTTCK